MENMMLNKIEIVGAATLTPAIQVQQVKLDSDGNPTGSYHRYVLNPLDDVSNETPQVQAMAAAIFTAEIVAEAQRLADVAEAERVEQERIAAEQEATRLAEEEAARIAQEEAEAQRVADEQARIDAAVAAALAAQGA